MQEGYPSAKAEFPNLPSKELISLVARRWKDLGIEARAAWKERAQQQTASSEDDPASRASFLYLPPKDIDNLSTREKQKDEHATGTGAVSNSQHLGEEE